MAANIPYDHLLFVEEKYFLASTISSVELGQSGNLTLTFDSNHNLTITDAEQVEEFKTQYRKFLVKNGIYINGDF